MMRYRNQNAITRNMNLNHRFNRVRKVIVSLHRARNWVESEGISRKEALRVDNMRSGGLNIVKSGGVGCKIADLPKKVKEFDTLSKNHVLEYLDEKLEDSTWQKKGKALALIEALLKGKSSDDVIEYFNQSPENVQSLLNSKKTILRKKAAAVMEYLKLDEEEDE